MNIFIHAPHQRRENGTFAFQKVEERCSYHLLILLKSTSCIQKKEKTNYLSTVKLKDIWKFKP